MAEIKDRAALESACKFIEQHVAPRKCDSDGVSHCWRCNSVYLARRMREMLSAAPSVTVVYGASAPTGPCEVCGVPYAEHGTYPTCASHPYTADASPMTRAELLRDPSCVGAAAREFGVPRKKP